VVGARTEKAARTFAGTGRAALTVRVPQSTNFLRRRDATNIYLVIGVVERDRGTLYCTVLFFAPAGSFLVATGKS